MENFHLYYNFKNMLEGLIKKFGISFFKRILEILILIFFVLLLYLNFITIKRLLFFMFQYQNEANIIFIDLNIKLNLYYDADGGYEIEDEICKLMLENLKKWRKEYEIIKNLN